MESSNGLSAPVKKRKKAKFNSNLTGFLMGGLPTVIAFCWLGFFPKIMGFILPFTKVQGTNLSTLTFVGLNNFRYLFTNPNSYFWKSFSVSCKYLFSVPIGMGIALFVATQLDKNIRGAKGFRVIMFLPTFVSGVAMSIFWRYVFQTAVPHCGGFFGRGTVC